ncbi:MAG: hypothetical protein Q7S28_01120 [bacterium]|nr:hypothetical protein [bacterium]
MKIQPAIWAALDEHGITDPATRKKLCREAGKILGKRGGIKTAELRRKSAISVRNETRMPEQISLQFT